VRNWPAPVPFNQNVRPFCIDLGGKEIPAARVQELSRVVNAEFLQRSVISPNEGTSKVQ
jgi:hypothetical protein